MLNQKWVFFLGLAVTIETAIGHGSVSLLNVVPSSIAPYVVGWCSFLAFIGTAIMTALSGYNVVSGPSASSPAAKEAMLLGILILGSLLLPTHASAQVTLKRPAITGNLPADIATDLHGGTTAKPSIAGVTLTGDITKDGPKIWAAILSANSADLNYAAAMAKAAGTPASATRLRCLNAIIAVNAQASGSAILGPDGKTPAAKPDPHAISDIESVAELVDNLSPQGALFTSCAGAAQMFKTNVLALINGMVTGVAAFGATGGVLP